ncbi:MAG: MlaE family lipid ABC transporter permease subunit [Nitrospirota bacterium]|nr:MAG: MlaE family lipid ABC transporter permease subunit [Nitrospirota bacterium]
MQKDLTNHNQATIRIGEEETIFYEGNWTIQELSDLEHKLRTFSWPKRDTLVCDGSRITAMDTGGAVFLHLHLAAIQQEGQRVVWRGLRPEFEALLKLISLNYVQLKSTTPSVARNWLDQIGRASWIRLQNAIRALGFLGESASGLFRAVFAPRSLRWRILFNNLEVDGFNALPIIGLLSFLMGIVIAYQGAEQLKTFGANIYIVDLVGISMLREIAPLVTAILVAGRSGSAYTAQIGTMKVTEELDAVRTLGISPMQLLVLPKVLVLTIALPLLTVYADVVGVFGGMLIASAQLDISFTEFIARFEYAIVLKHYIIGLIKAPVFAIIIALVGCYQGFQIHGGVDSVGRHTTISVVQSIFLVIVFDSLFSIFLNWWGI